MGVADREYMKRQGRNDAYYKRLFDPPGSSASMPESSWSPSAEPRRRTRGHVGAIWLPALTLFGLFVLPHLAIYGHHYRFWML